MDDGSTDGSGDVIRRSRRGRSAHPPAPPGVERGAERGVLRRVPGRARPHRGHHGQRSAERSRATFPRSSPELDGADAVVGWRQIRHDSWLKRLSSWTANGIRQAVTGDRLEDSACSLRVMRRECLAAIPPYTGMHRFVPTLLKLAGYPGRAGARPSPPAPVRSLEVRRERSRVPRLRRPPGRQVDDAASPSLPDRRADRSCGRRTRPRSCAPGRVPRRSAAADVPGPAEQHEGPAARRHALEHADPRRDGCRGCRSTSTRSSGRAHRCGPGSPPARCVVRISRSGRPR